MPQVIDTKLATYKAKLIEKREYLSQVQNAERQTTQELLALQGAIQALEETNAEMLSTAGQEDGDAEGETPQPGTVDLG